jgi:hypothetical protein
MPCEKCRAEPDFHSFKKFGTKGEETLFYTSPAKTKDFATDGSKLTNVLQDITELTDGKPWGWVLDCRNMDLRHYTDLSFNLGILQMLQDDPQNRTLWILHPNLWIRTTLALLRSFSYSPIFDRVEYLEGSNLELYDRLSKAGLEPSAIRWLLGQ